MFKEVERNMYKANTKLVIAFGMSITLCVVLLMCCMYTQSLLQETCDRNASLHQQLREVTSHEK